MLVAGKKKNKKSSSGAAVGGGDEGAAMSPDDPQQSVLPQMQSGDEVVFSADFTRYEVGATWRYRTLDAWLNERRIEGKLLTKQMVEPGLLYQFLVDNPSTFLGELFGASKETGKWIYGSLWAVATLGITVQAMGYAAGAARGVTEAGIAARALPAAVGASEAASVAAAATKVPRFKMMMANLRNARAGIAAARRRGIKSSAKMMNFSGQIGAARAVNSMRIGNAAQIISKKAAGLGAGVAATALMEGNVSEGYSEDLAASGLEALADFTAEHSVRVGPAGIEFPIGSLPGTDDTPAVQDFNKFMIGYIMRFQMSTYED